MDIRLETYDVLVAGAGYAGAVSARALAEKGKKVRVFERRDHIGGNAYDCLDGHGVLIHKYGPHIFHTNDKKVFDFLSRFTEWRDYQHRVVANIPDPAGGGRPGWRLQYPVPFNLTSLETAFGPEEGKKLGDKLIAAYGAEKKVTILELRQNPDRSIAALADYVYEHVFVHYTMKQWGQKPEEIDPNTTARVPVFLSRDDRYFQDTYQGMPVDGYTRLFEAMLGHDLITVCLGTEAESVFELVFASGDEDAPLTAIRIKGEAFEGPIVYTGPLDELFLARFGRLPYRSLDFVYETFEEDYHLPAGTVNYTVTEDYTRVTEFKWLTGQKGSKTTIMKEYSRAYEDPATQIPYYAIINGDNADLYGRYRRLTDALPNFYPLGRLAEYRYFNMDKVVVDALAAADRILWSLDHPDAAVPDAVSSATPAL